MWVGGISIPFRIDEYVHPRHNNEPPSIICHGVPRKQDHSVPPSIICLGVLRKQDHSVQGVQKILNLKQLFITLLIVHILAPKLRGIQNINNKITQNIYLLLYTGRFDTFVPPLHRQARVLYKLSKYIAAN